VFIDKKDNSTSFTGNIDSQTGQFTTQFLVGGANGPISTSDGHAQIGKGGGGTDTFTSMTFFIDDPDNPGGRWPVIHDFVFDTGGVLKKDTNDVTVTGLLNGGTKFQQTVTGLKGSDLTWLLLGTDSNIFDTIVVSSVGGFEFIKHMYVSGTGPSIDPQCTVDCVPQVPLPAALPLFGTALGGLFFLRSRRRAPTAA
jgi:hypothetical protein